MNEIQKEAREQRAQLLQRIGASSAAIEDARRAANTAFENGDAAWYAYAFGMLRQTVQTIAGALHRGDVASAEYFAGYGLAFCIALDGEPVDDVAQPAFPQPKQISHTGRCANCECCYASECGTMNCPAKVFYATDPADRCPCTILAPRSVAA